MSDAEGTSGSQSDESLEFVLDWPDHDRPAVDAVGDENAFRLAWEGRTSESTAVAPPVRSPRSESVPATTAPSDSPAPSRPPIRLRTRSASASPPYDRHEACRDQISHLEATVSQLRAELAVVRAETKDPSSPD